MDALTYAKVSAVLTVLYAGLNLHQLMCPYAYFMQRIEELKSMLDTDMARTRISKLSLFFYFALPSLFLFLLGYASVPRTVILTAAMKFLITAWLGLWAEKSIFASTGYTPLHHGLGKLDNVLNLILSGLVVYFLLFPIRE